MLQESDTRRQWGKLHKTAKRKYAGKKRRAWVKSNLTAIENGVLAATVLAAAMIYVICAVGTEDGLAAANLFLEYAGLGFAVTGLLLTILRLRNMTRLKKAVMNACIFALAAVLFCLRGVLAWTEAVRVLLPLAATALCLCYGFFGDHRRS